VTRCEGYCRNLPRIRAGQPLAAVAASVLPNYVSTDGILDLPRRCRLVSENIFRIQGKMFLRKQVGHDSADTFRLFPDVGARRSSKHCTAAFGGGCVVHIEQLLIEAGFYFRRTLPAALH